jgi:hypothetical protein
MKEYTTKKITYFNEPGIKNTVQTLLIARETSIKNNINRMLIASTYGHTIKKALEIFNGMNIQFIVVGGKKNDFPDELYKKLIKENHQIIFNSDYDFRYPKIAWEILRRFSEGMKVAVQMNLMVSDIGLLPAGEEIIAVAGTGRVDFPTGGGADTAIVTETVKSGNFFSLDLPQSISKIEGRKIKEILCKPG